MLHSSTSPSSPSPPISPPPHPFSTLSPCFSVARSLDQLHFLTLKPQLSHSTSLQLYSWLYAFFSSLCSSSYFLDNSLTFSGLLPDHFFIWARHPLQVVLSPPNVSSTLCPLLLQPCFFPTPSSASEDLSWGLRCIYIYVKSSKKSLSNWFMQYHIFGFPFKNTHMISNDKSHDPKTTRRFFLVWFLRLLKEDQSLYVTLSLRTCPQGRPLLPRRAPALPGEDAVTRPTLRYL